MRRPKVYRRTMIAIVAALAALIHGPALAQQTKPAAPHVPVTTPDEEDHSAEAADVSRQLPLGSRIMLTMSPLHYGTFGGAITRWIWILVGLVPGILSITGFLMWWNRQITASHPAPLPRAPFVPSQEVR